MLHKTLAQCVGMKANGEGCSWGNALILARCNDVTHLIFCPLDPLFVRQAAHQSRSSVVAVLRLHLSLSSEGSLMDEFSVRAVTVVGNEFPRPEPIQSKGRTEFCRIE